MKPEIHTALAEISGFSGSIHVSLAVLIGVAIFAIVALLVSMLLMRRK
jgi:hypothetical protein